MTIGVIIALRLIGFIYFLIGSWFVGICNPDVDIKDFTVTELLVFLFGQHILTILLWPTIVIIKLIVIFIEDGSRKRKEFDDEP